MPFNLKYSAALRNAMQDAIATSVGSGANLKIYSGTQPATPETAIGAQVLLATLNVSGAFAAAAASGVLTANAFSNGTGTAGAGAGTTATWFRLETSGGTARIDGTVGISGCDLNLNNTSIATGQTVSVTSFTLTNGNS